MVGERANWEYLEALGGLDRRNTSHTRRGLPGLSHPRSPPKQIGGNGRQEMLTDNGVFKCRGGTMASKLKDEILYDHNHDGIDRRGFLKCMAWAGTGALCVMSGGVLKSYRPSRLPEVSSQNATGGLSIVQITDSHMGFNKTAKPDL